jgi:hypothetical protein
MSSINNPLSQLAQIYALLEANLRKAATSHKPLTLVDLNSIPEIKDKVKSAWQVRDCMGNLAAKDFVIKTGVGKAKNYIWNLNAPPFVLKTSQREKIKTQPSEPVIKQEKKRAVHSTPSQEYELVIGNTMITIGKNPSTGNMRLTIEEIK